MRIEVNSIDELSKAAQSIMEYAGDRKIWVFEGGMGAGKTTLIKAICRELDIIDNTSSPTFSLVNVYLGRNQKEYYHFDFYRINDQEEALDIGCDEYFYSGNYCFIEWPEKIPSLIPETNLKISINLSDQNRRVISLSKND